MLILMSQKKLPRHPTFKIAGVIPLIVKFLMKVHGFEGASYVVSNSEYMVRRYGVHSFERTGYIVSHYP